MNKPNIVYLLLDDLGPYELSCLGHPTLETPNLDRLIQSGMRFENAYSGAPVCAPARSALMTGQHTGHTSVRGNLGGIPLLKEDVTAAQTLKDAGYATGGFGKWGCGDAGTDGAPEKHGFDLFYGYYHQVHAHTYFTDYLWRNGQRVNLEDGAYSQYLIHDEAKRFIRQNRDRPFFCYLPYTPPHGRFEIPDSDPGWAQYRDRPWEEGPRRRAAMISMVDRHAGEILDLLDELNLTENTLLLFASDNGGGREFNDFFKPNRDLKGGKGNLYEGGIRVPFAARWPGRIEPNSTCDFPTYFPDFLPTAAEIAEAPLPPDMDGVSIAPSFLGESERQTERGFLYWEYTRVANWQRQTYAEKGLQQAVRQGKWKIARMRIDAQFELYDLENDPNETTDLAGEHPQLTADLARLAEASHTPPPPQTEPEMPPGRRFR